MEEDQKQTRRVTRTILIMSAVIAAISLYLLLAVELPSKPLAGQGGAPDDDVPIGGEFVLTDQDGNKFSSDMMKGKLSLVYFGFTYCPDICPTSLQKLTNVLQTLDKYNIEVLPIFITIDPARDKPALLREYLGHFHPKFIGLTGSQEEIKKVADLYKVFFAISDDGAEEGKYMVDHSSFVYLMDKKGRYMKHFYMSSTPEEIIEFIRVNK